MYKYHRVKVCKGPAAMHAFVDRSSAAAHLASVSASCAAHKTVVAPVEGCVYTQLLASLRAGEGAPCLVRSVERGALRNRRRCIFRICTNDNSGGLNRGAAVWLTKTATIVADPYSEYEEGRRTIFGIWPDDNNGGLNRGAAVWLARTATIVVGAYSECAKKRHFIFRISRDLQKPCQLVFQRLQHIPHVRFSPLDDGCRPQRPGGVVRNLRKKSRKHDSLRHLCPRQRAARSQKLARNCLVERALSCAYERLNRERPGVGGREARGRSGHHLAVRRCERREECWRGS